jgi:16S rRNA processing protein RimM
MSKYLIGHITNTHGIRGEVKIYNYSDFNRFFVGAEIYVELKTGKKAFVVERVRPQGNLFIVKFKGYDNINDILMYKGLDLYSDDNVDDELEDDDYHYSMLIGKPCLNEEGVLLGHVKSMIPVPQGHLIELTTVQGKQAMIPFNKVFVKDVDQDKIILTPIEGLL